MSQTLFIEYRGRGFWAFDVVSSVLLKHLLDVASPLARDNPWLAEAVGHWKQNAVVADLGFFIDNSWSEEQTRVLCELLDSACRLLQQREGIPAEEIEAWQIHDAGKIYARGIPVVPTRAAIQLGRGIIALIQGTLPKPPVGYWWFFTIEDAPKTMRKRSHFKIAILEDNAERQQAMKAAVDEALPDAVCFFFNSAHEMIDRMRYWLDSPPVLPPALISLDHDLELLPGPEGRQIDPGDGRDIAEFLATQKPFCPVIVHTSNSVGAASMACNLQDAGWQVARVHPESDLGWVKSNWVLAVSRLAYEWQELHG